jgi:hypothetical protein
MKPPNLQEQGDPDACMEQFIDQERAARALGDGLVCVDAPDRCNLCGRSLADQRFLVDGEASGTPLTRVPGGRLMGQWSYMCAACFRVRGIGIRWGTGQLYERQLDGLWVMVGGFPPEADSNS